jgi:hypothetical protein
MLEYRIVVGVNEPELERLVRAAIAEGWRPLGGVSFARWVSVHNHEMGQWAQAMTRGT